MVRNYDYWEAMQHTEFEDQLFIANIPNAKGNVRSSAAEYARANKDSRGFIQVSNSREHACEFLDGCGRAMYWIENGKTKSADVYSLYRHHNINYQKLMENINRALRDSMEIDRVREKVGEYIEYEKCSKCRIHQAYPPETGLCDWCADG